MVEDLVHIKKRLVEEGDKTIAFFDSLSESGLGSTRIHNRLRLAGSATLGTFCFC